MLLKNHYIDRIEPPGEPADKTARKSRILRRDMIVKHIKYRLYRNYFLDNFLICGIIFIKD
ncbi:MAG TPA: hypothetical protein DCP17_06125 [Ruminococcaceae bacterium]|nr:hypothetical protein [Oscillospiraceae bacterium]